MTIDWIQQPITPPSELFRKQALQRQSQLTKPPGSLGKLEEIAVTLASMQQCEKPSLDTVRIVVFAGDHGIAEANVSAFPQSVTVEMIKNFSRGGAAISVLARHLNAQLEVVDTGTLTDPSPLPHLISRRIGNGTKNFRHQPAMSDSERDQALTIGKEAVERGKNANTQLFIGGEMGIGNTTSASAILAALLGISPILVSGRGTGLDPKGVERKAIIISEALDHHCTAPNDPMRILSALGGFEIVALTGFFVASAQQGIPQLVDGFIASVAALVAVKLNPDVLNWLLFSHRSAELGHQKLLEYLKVTPILDMNMRLGEGSGAATSLPILRLACVLHAEMATFKEASISGSQS